MAARSWQGCHGIDVNVATHGRGGRLLAASRRLVELCGGELQLAAGEGKVALVHYPDPEVSAHPPSPPRAISERA